MSRRGRDATGLHAARVRRPQLRDRGPQQEPLDSDDDRSTQVYRVHSEQLHLWTLTHLGDASAATAGTVVAYQTADYFHFWINKRSEPQ